MDYEVKHDDRQCVFYVDADGHRATAHYRCTADSLDIDHTLVPPEIGGRGIASLLVGAAYDYARSRGLRPAATCVYAAAWLRRHPEYMAGLGAENPDAKG